MTTTVLVTGASGFIGRHLATALAATEGVRVRAMSRRPGRLASRLPGTEVVEGELGDPASLRRAASGAEVVYHLAGAYRGSPDELWESNVGGTTNLVSALEPGTRLVHVSSTSVYGWDQDWPADEMSPTRPSSAYGRAKVTAERVAEEWGGRAGGGTTVVARPTITYGPGDERGMLPRALRLMEKGLRRFPGTGDNRIHLVHVDDLVRALLILRDRGQGTYVVAGPRAEPVRRVLGLLASGAGLAPPSFGIPAAPLLRAAAVAEGAWSAARRRGEPPLTRHSVEVVTRDRAYSCARAERDLGWKAEVGIDDGIPLVGEALAAAAGKGGAAGGGALGFDWRAYLDDPDEGLGTVYERFALDQVLEAALARTGAHSVLHAPAFGMMGFPGIDAVLLARRGVRVGLLDFDADRLAAVHRQWLDLGLRPETHLVGSDDPAAWPERLPASYDLVFSFAALWWFADPGAVLAAQSRWATRGVLCCVPNRNVFMRLRAGLWHRGLFRHLNGEALDRDRLGQAAAAAGLEPVDTGLFDIPPFPDTSVPLAKVLRAWRGRSAPADGEGRLWAWSILPYLRGEDPAMKDRVARLARWERFVPPAAAPALAHHRYVLFVRPGVGATAGAAATQTA